jgi:hypothetical protein
VLRAGEPPMQTKHPQEKLLLCIITIQTLFALLILGNTAQIYFIVPLFRALFHSFLEIFRNFLGRKQIFPANFP